VKKHSGDWLRLALAVTFGLAILVRVNNAGRYPEFYGFDAEGNWQYVQHLAESWTLPDPEAGWSTSKPPFFYYLAAILLRLLKLLGLEHGVLAVRLASAGCGLGMAWIAVAVVRRCDPTNSLRAFLAGALLVFVPAHIYLSAMVNEGILADGLVSAAVALLAVGAAGSGHPGPRSQRRAAAIGLTAGLAWLTKLSGLLALGTALATYSLEALRRRALRRTAPLILCVGVVGIAVGGSFYLRNLIQYGYAYPHGLAQHKAMMSNMPPGSRSVTDYVRIPAATFTAPQLLDPRMLHSVWGSAYASLWFDGYRFFVPHSDAKVRAVGSAILLLALLPSVAFAVGVSRGARRALSSPGTPDTPLLLHVALTLIGFALFTWQNPWYVTVKGTYLLGLTVPFTYYTSEVLADWLRTDGLRRWLVGGSLILLAALVTLSFTYGLVWEKPEGPGLLFLRFLPKWM
jgi:hypothetical protein